MAYIPYQRIRWQNLFPERHCRTTQVVSCLFNCLLDKQQNTRYANWEATLEPVNLLPSGEFQVPDDQTVLGPKGIRLTKSKALLGYILAQYIDGDDEEPARSDCVDLYIENAIEKLKAYLFKLLQSQRLKQSKGDKDGT